MRHLIPVSAAFVLTALAPCTPLAAEHEEAKANPCVLKANDAKLKKEFEYLVFDLGKGVELRLVKVPTKGKRFLIGSSKDEQDEVVTKYHSGKRPASMEFENEQQDRRPERGERRRA